MRCDIRRSWRLLTFIYLGETWRLFVHAPGGGPADDGSPQKPPARTRLGAFPGVRYLTYAHTTHGRML